MLWLKYIYFKMEVTDPLLRQKIEEVAREMFEGIC